MGVFVDVPEKKMGGQQSVLGGGGTKERGTHCHAEV